MRRLAVVLAVSLGSTAVLAPRAMANKTEVVERIVARVNNNIITNVDIDKAKQGLIADLQQQANGASVPPAELQSQEKNLLRDLIDQQLLIQRANDLGISAETDTIRRLDQIRQQMHLNTMEDLQKAVEAQGQDFEDFKQNIRNSILTQKVIEEDVAPRIDINPGEIQAYYNAHKSEFKRQNEVGLSEILIATKGKTPAQVKALKDLADQIRARAANGEAFDKMAQQYSNSQSATNGGNIGFFKKGQLAPAIEKDVFSLGVNGVTPVITTDNGFLILKVMAIHHAGQETLDEARNEVQYDIYQQKLQPELRHFLTKLRTEAYIKIQPGFTDTGASANSGVNLERFERVLPQDMPKPVDKPKSGGMGGSMQ